MRAIFSDTQDEKSRHVALVTETGNKRGASNAAAIFV